MKRQIKFLSFSLCFVVSCAQVFPAFADDDSGTMGYPNQSQKAGQGQSESQQVSDTQEESPKHRFRPGQRFAERRRMRQQRQMQKLQSQQFQTHENPTRQNLLRSQPAFAPNAKTGTSIEKSRDRSIDVISGDDLEKSQSRSKANEKNASINEEAKDEDNKSNKEKSENKTTKEAPCLSWLNPLGKPKAIILCVHGLGLHSGSFAQFGKAMAVRGYAVYAVDVRGFGSWMAAKGREKCDFKHCSDDIVSTLNVLRMANPNVPVFLLGESMGGAIALDVASENPSLIDGLISAVPAAERFNTGRTDFKVFMHLLTGNRKVNVEKSVVNQATANPALREEWAEDPLGRMDLSAKELMQFQAFMNDNHDRAKKIDRMPVLIVQGGKDKLVKAEGTKELFERLVTPDKNLAMVNGAEHLVYEEGQFSKEVLDLTDNWISQRLPNQDGQAASFDLMKARAMMQSKQFFRVIPLLQQVVTQEPENPEPYVMLGLALMRTGHPLKAREQVRKAFSIAHASKDPNKARKANDLLLNLPPEMVAPVLARAAQGGMPGRAGGRIASGQGLLSAPMQGNYKVLIFSAKWCEPCKDLEPVINEARARFGKKVEFTVLDVDDERNQPLIEKYHVSPVPTMIFLRPNGEVADYSVGFSGVSGMIKGIAKMLLPG